MKYLSFSFIMILILMACGDEDLASDPLCDIQYGTPFTIEAGITYCQADGSQLVINQFTNSICPCFADCIWEGEIQVEATLIDADGSESPIFIHTVRTEENTERFSVFSASISEECEPKLQEIQIVVAEN